MYEKSCHNASQISSENTKWHDLIRTLIFLLKIVSMRIMRYHGLCFNRIRLGNRRIGFEDSNFRYWFFRHIHTQAVSIVIPFSKQRFATWVKISDNQVFQRFTKDFKFGRVWCVNSFRLDFSKILVIGYRF